jgi:hypothetical protein
MNAKNLLPLTAVAVFALCAGSMVISATHADNNVQAATASADANIVTLPAVSVKPDPADLAHFQTYRNVKVVDLAAVNVRPTTEDMAHYLANQAVRIVDMPVVTVRPSAQDMQEIATQAGALASRFAAR